MASRDLVVAAAGASAPSDPNFKNVSLLLTGDGTNGAQNNTFLDASTNNFTITRNGNTTQGTFSPYGSLWSNYFDGSGDYLTVPDNAAFTLGNGNWTVECWVYRTTSGARTFIYGQSDGSNSVSIASEVRADNKLATYAYVGATEYAAVSTNVFPQNQWVHVAIVRNGGTISQYINGVVDGQNTTIGTATINDVSVVFGIGILGSYGLVWNGYISNFRLVKGTALYTSNFIPSTTPLTAVSGTSLLTCQSNRFIDNSSNNFTLTVNGNTSVQRFSPFNPTAPYSASTIGGSGYFDGTGSLTLGGQSQFAFGTGDWTIEFWVNLSQINSSSMFIDFRPTTTNGSYPFIYYESGAIFYQGTSIATIAIKEGVWYHIAVSRSGTSTKVFLNGSQLGSTLTDSTSYLVGANRPMIGGNGYLNGGTSSYNTKGYISNLRVVKGTAVYTTTFTPPTSPVTAVSGTSLLCNFTNAGIPDAAMMNNLETVGNAQVSTSVKKYGTGSLYFDGTGDYLITPSSSLYTLGSSAPFTIEGWFYLAASQTTDAILLSTTVNWSSDYVNRWAITATGTTVKWYNSAGSVTISSTISSGQWVHIAVCNTGSTITMYINGNSAGTQTTNLAYTTDGSLKVGGGVTNAANFNGYIDDLRITKGYARYTTNFTPPAQALPTN